MKRYSAVCMGVLFLGATAVIPGKTVADECVVNLNKGKHTCADIPDIEIQELLKAANGRGTGQAVVKVTLDGAVNPTGYTEATFKVKYSTAAEGWTVNIGDSQSNNGYRGDSGHQSNDAEIQIFRKDLESPNGLTVYGNDYRPEEELNPLLRYTLKGNRPKINLTVKNQFFGWERRGNIGKMKSEFLYALDGQLDDEGPENYDIYAAFNRTIGGAGRNGIGVGKVIIELKPDKAELESVPTVTSLTGRVWMDRNLGASRVAISSTDTEAYGDLYQWGRLTDGHEKRTSSTTTILSSTDIPGHDNFILLTSNISPYDWRNPQNGNMWQSPDGINNPCPQEFRVPTAAELEEERLSWSSNDSAGAFASPLKLTIGGRRGYGDGAIHYVGNYGAYWSSSGSRFLKFDGSTAYNVLNYSAARAMGISVRCIQALPEE